MGEFYPRPSAPSALGKLANQVTHKFTISRGSHSFGFYTGRFFRSCKAHVTQHSDEQKRGGDFVISFACSSAHVFLLTRENDRRFIERERERETPPPVSCDSDTCFKSNSSCLLLYYVRLAKNQLHRTTSFARCRARLGGGGPVGRGSRRDRHGREIPQPQEASTAARGRSKRRRRKGEEEAGWNPLLLQHLSTRGHASEGARSTTAAPAPAAFSSGASLACEAAPADHVRDLGQDLAVPDAGGVQLAAGGGGGAVQRPAAHDGAGKSVQHLPGQAGLELDALRRPAPVLGVRRGPGRRRRARPGPGQVRRGNRGLVRLHRPLRPDKAQLASAL